jgi:hypothetical protein
LIHFTIATVNRELWSRIAEVKVASLTDV